MVNFYIACASWGNDSVAMVAWLTEHAPQARRVVVHNITGWHSEDWPARVDRCSSWAKSLGWEVHTTRSDLVQVATTGRRGFPSSVRPWCSRALKIEPTMQLLGSLDPEREAVVCVGVRREESPRRSTFPEHVAADDPNNRHGGRDCWAPLVRKLVAERDAILRRHGFEPLPYRSHECNPCMNADKDDIRSLTEERIAEIEAAEAASGRTFFPPSKAMGAKGIRAVVRWAHTDRGRYHEAQASLCDGGWCGL